MPDLCAAVLLSLLASAAASPAPRTYERAIRAAGPGRLAAALDAAVYDAARADLGDLRVLDDQGRAVPFVLDRAADDAPDRHPAALRDRVFDRGAFARVTLDFGRRLLKDELTLALSGDSFRRRVVVEGRDDGGPWAVLVDDAYVFAVPGRPPARYETVPLPENDFRELRVTVHHDEGDPSRIEVRDAWTDARAGRRPREVRLPVKLQRVEDAERRETILVLHLGASGQPFRGVVLDVADARFWRGVVVEAREDPVPGRPLAWRALADGAIYRHPGADGRQAESLRVFVCGRARVLRLRVRNRDDEPLTVRSAAVLAPVERVVFEALPGRSYRLVYGDTRLGAPAYDLARTAGDLAAFAAAAAPAALDEPRVVEAGEAGAAKPWTERHPALLWGGLVAVILALGAVTWQALRREAAGA